MKSNIRINLNLPLISATMEADSLRSTRVCGFHFFVGPTLFLPGTQQARLFTQQLNPRGSIYDSRLHAAAQIQSPLCVCEECVFSGFFLSFFLNSGGRERERQEHA